MKQLHWLSEQRDSISRYDYERIYSSLRGEEKRAQYYQRRVRVLIRQLLNHVQEEDLWCRLGDLYDSPRRKLGCYRQALKCNPDSVEAMKSIIFVFICDLEEPQNALPWLENALSVAWRTKQVDEVLLILASDVYWELKDSHRSYYYDDLAKSCDKEGSLPLNRYPN